MSRGVYDLVAGGIFSLVLILHILRLFYGWQAEIGGVTIPLWVSWVAVAAAGYMAFWGFKSQR